MDLLRCLRLHDLTFVLWLCGTAQPISASFLALGIEMHASTHARHGMAWHGMAYGMPCHGSEEEEGVKGGQSTYISFPNYWCYVRRSRRVFCQLSSAICCKCQAMPINAYECERDCMHDNWQPCIIQIIQMHIYIYIHTHRECVIGGVDILWFMSGVSRTLHEDRDKGNDDNVTKIAVNVMNVINV